MKRLSQFGLFLGLALLTVLVMGLGWQPITTGLQEAGWTVFWLPVYYLLPLICALLSWWYLFDPDLPRPGVGLSIYCTWINFAVNWLLPVAQVGGEIARVRLLLKRQFPAGGAIASIIGDQTLQLISQALYAVVGLILLAWTQWDANLFPESNPSRPTHLFLRLGLSLILLIALSGGFYWIQRQGIFKVLSRVAHQFPTLIPDAQQTAITIDQAVVEMYERRDRLLIATIWRCGFRLFAAGETWLALNFLGHPVGIVEAIALESLGQAIRSAAFLIPGGLGAQEAGIMGVGSLLGIPTSTGLSLSLCKRIRELVIGVPGLIALQVEEGQGLIDLQQKQ